MKRFIKHIGQTTLLIALICGMSLLPRADMGYWGTAFVWGCVAVSVGTLIWLARHYGKRAVVLILILSGGLMLETAARAEDESRCLEKQDAEMYQCLIELYGETDFCRAKKDFDADDAVKNNEPPDEELIKKTVKYLDIYDRAVSAGYTTLHGGWSEFFSMGSASGKYEDRYDCAKDFLEEVADYRQKKSKMDIQMVYPILQSERGKCWPCEIVSMVMTVSESLAFSLDEPLREAALMLLGIMFLFWILLQVLGMIQKMGAFRPSEFFTEFLIRSILAVIVAALLSLPIGTIYEYTLSPITSAVSVFNGKMIRSNVNNTLGTRLVGLEVLGCDCCNAGSTSNCSGGDILNTRVNGVDIGIFEMETKRQLVCMTCQVYKQTQPMVAAGQVMLYHTWNNKTMGIPSPFGVCCIGLALIICFVWISFAIAFRIIDLFLYLGFVVLMTPFAIATFVFPKTRTYTKKTWDLFAYALTSLLGITISVLLVMAILNTEISPAMISKLQTLMTMQGTVPNNYAIDLADAFGGGENGTLYTLFFFLMLCFFGLKVIKASQSMVSGLFDIACGLPAVSGMAVMALGRMAVSATALTLSVIGDRLDRGSIPKESRGAADKKTWQETAAKAAKSAGKMAEKAQELAGKGIEATGKGVSSLGKGLSATGLGAIVGVPLMVVGAGMQATGKTVTHTAKITGKAVEKGIKASAKAVDKAQKTAKRAWNKVARPIANRMKQVKAAYNKIKGKIPNGVKKAARRSASALKYGGKKAGKWAWDGVQKLPDKAQAGLDMMEDSFSNTEYPSENSPRS